MGVKLAIPFGAGGQDVFDAPRIEARERQAASYVSSISN
jgi:hypothetical protein